MIRRPPIPPLFPYPPLSLSPATFPADNLFHGFGTCLFDMPRLPDQLEPLLAWTCFCPTLFRHRLLTPSGRNVQRRQLCEFRCVLPLLSCCLPRGFLSPQQTLRSNRLRPVPPSRRRTSRTKSLTRRQPPSSGWPGSSRTINSG